MPPDGRPPRLGASTLRTRAARAPQIYNAKQRARNQVADEFETQSPEEIPIDRRGDQFAPPEAFFERAEPIEAAARFDEQFPQQTLTRGDVRQTEQGFEPTQQVRETAAAFELDEQFGLVDLGPPDVEPVDDGGFGLTPMAEREVTASQIEDETPLSDVDPQGDLTKTDDGFQLDQAASERLFDLDRSFF